MKRTLAALLAIPLAGVLATAPASAKRAHQKVKGEVVQVERNVQSQSGGEYDRLTIRTRQGEQLHLRLGEGGACDGCFLAGDMVRARVQARVEARVQARVEARVQAGEGPQVEYQVRSLKLRREGRMFKFREEGGRMVLVRGRLGPGPGAGRHGGPERAGGPGPGKGRPGGGGPGGP